MTINEVHVNIEGEDEEMLENAFDDVTGKELDPREVAEGRTEELEFMETREIWTDVPTEDLLEDDGSKADEREVGGRAEGGRGQK